MKIEAIITFETAKLAKEKGFDISTISYYSPKGRLEESEGYMTERLESSNWNNGQGSYPTHAKDVECSAPTQSLLQKWLREKRIDIAVITDWKKAKRVYYVGFSFVNDKNQIDIWFGKDEDKNKIEYFCYEDALEVGLQESIKLTIK